jgi:hypothetical protein
LRTARIGRSAEAVSMTKRVAGVMNVVLALWF